MFSGSIFYKIFTGIFLVVSIVGFILLLRRPTISLLDLQDNGEPIDHQKTLDWWNFYNHPLTVNAEDA